MLDFNSKLPPIPTEPPRCDHPHRELFTRTHSDGQVRYGMVCMKCGQCFAWYSARRAKMELGWHLQSARKAGGLFCEQQQIVKRYYNERAPHNAQYRAERKEF